MRSILAIFFPIFLIPFFLFSQPEACGSDLVEEILQNQNLNYFQESVDFDYQMKREILSRRNNPNRDEDTIVYTIPLVFHVLYEFPSEDISDTKIINEIDNLNEMFRNVGFYDSTQGADARIQFCLAKLDTNGFSTTGIRHIETFHANSGQDMTFKALYNWDPTKYLNVYIASTLLGSGGVLGYAYYPTSHGQTWDGIVMQFRLIDQSKASSAVFAHEIGHYLGLPHPFNQGCQNYDCLLDGDRICDTPPDNRSEVYEGCRVVNHCTTDADDPSMNNPFTSDVPDMNNLYMDYNNQICQNAFTEGQVERMRTVLSVIRGSLFQSTVCQQPELLDVGISGILTPVITQCETDLNLEIEIRNYGLNPISSTNILAQIDQGSITAINWSGNISYTDVDTFSFPTNTALTPGTHELTVYTSSPNGGTDQLASNDTFKVLFNYLPATETPFIKDFESGLGAEWTIDNPGGIGWSIAPYNSDSLNTPGQSLYIDNTIAYLAGLQDRLLSPLIDLNYADSALLKFDIAFPYDSALLGPPREEFVVTYSLDCGETFVDSIILFNASRFQLASANISADTVDTWAPASFDDWRTFEVDLGFLAGEEIILSFDFQKGDNSFPLYLDNIRVEASFSTAIDESPFADRFAVYPNPGKGNYQVELEIPNAFHSAKLAVRNIQGQEIMRKQLPKSTDQLINIDIQNQPAGLYFFELEVDNQRIVKKVMKL